MTGLRKWLGRLIGKTKHLGGVFWLVALLGIGTLFLPLIANDKPLIIVHQKTLYFPLIKDYPETSFGGVFETPADYGDPVVKALIAKEGFMVMPPISYGQNTLITSAPEPHPSAPTPDNWLGTDVLGHDVFVRTMYGIRLSFWFGLALTLVGSCVGLMVGAVLGYFGGLVDLFGQRLIEIWFGLPQLFILMIIFGVFDVSLWLLFVVMLLFGWLPLVALARLQTYRLAHAGFVLSAKNLGVPAYLVIYRHFLPSLLRLSMAQFPFILASNITVLTALDFLGVGLSNKTASLGALLYDASRHLDRPHLMVASVGSLSVILVALIILGERTRRALVVR